MRCFTISLLVALAGCGGGTDGSIDESQIVGTWTGTSVIEGQTSNSGVSLVLSSTGAGQVFVTGICPDGTSAIVANVTSATSFSLIGSTCLSVAFGNCASVTVSITSGSGSIANNTLTLNANGTGSGCGSSAAETISFTGTRQ